eukprot:TRINITY_DN21517_c0_g1_i1.p1 TRINITY_DN21517_c0_g1~~TRINITY_DN21517_c0_g1_i1.p1  ORF type:complete len:626 (+),score=122.66 TRINITY_DN21517_c0_g1_i1:19-1896(+)
MCYLVVCVFTAPSADGLAWIFFWPLMWVITEAPDADAFYYWNIRSDETSWEAPRGVDVEWRTKRSALGELYYHNPKTGETRWDLLPPEVFEDRIDCVSRLKAASRPIPSTHEDDAFDFVQCYRGKDVPPPGHVCSVGSCCPSLPSTAEERTASKDDRQSCWIAVFNAEGQIREYWDSIQGASSRHPPSGVVVEWNCTYSTEYSACYYCNVQTQEVRWEVPGNDDDNDAFFDVSCDFWQAVRLGSDAGERYCGQVGTVEAIYPRSSPKAFVVSVKLPAAQGGTTIDVRESSVLPLAVGDGVELRGEDGEPSGVFGVVTRSAESTFGDLEVRVVEGIEKDMVLTARATQLLPRSRLRSMEVDEAKLPWRTVQDLQFVCSEGKSHGYKLVLPHGLNRCCPKVTCSRCASAENAWPLLIYMHGAGGGHLMERSKKSMKLHALNFAAEHFVVASPKCEWKWKEEPHKWVLELVRQLRACSFIDPARIYLTGCSMGGMGTWELAAAAPELFAAVAPVAGHHQSARREYIAERLRSMPILSIAVPGDDTCPFADEEALWNLLLEKGNTRLQVYSANGINHAQMFGAAFTKAPVIFEWLLQHRRGDPCAGASDAAPADAAIAGAEGAACAGSA